MKIYDIDTPALLIEKSKLVKNIQTMQGIANFAGVKLRPHTKTHKMPDIAKNQIDAGAKGIAVAKLGEAEVFADFGFSDIQIANIIIGDSKLDRLFKLNEKLDKLSCCVDSIEGLIQLRQRFAESSKELNVMIEIDSGLGRCGLKEKEDVLNLAKEIKKSDGLNFLGLLTHAGQAYSAQSIEEIMAIGKFEGEFMADIAKFLEEKAIEVKVVSVGSTPTAEFSSSIKGVTEIRPGNYVFYDMIQVALGVTTIEKCALSVLATVISKPSDNRIIIDAGSKALHTDRGAHGNEKLKSYGFVPTKNCSILRLSEEHGFIYHNEEKFIIGEKIRIIPNHACAVTNLFDFAYLVDGSEVVEIYYISARGKLT